MRLAKMSMGILTILVEKITWAVGSSRLCTQYTSGWIYPWPPPHSKKPWIRLRICCNIKIINQHRAWYDCGARLRHFIVLSFKICLLTSLDVNLSRHLVSFSFCFIVEILHKCFNFQNILWQRQSNLVTEKRGAISYNKVFDIVPLVKIQICLSILMRYSENYRLKLN